MKIVKTSVELVTFQEIEIGNYEYRRYECKSWKLKVENDWVSVIGKDLVDLEQTYTNCIKAMARSPGKPTLNKARLMPPMTASFWCIVAVDEYNRETILFEYARDNPERCRNSVRDKAWRTSKFTGTTELLMKHRGRKICQFTAVINPNSIW